jgi:prevent-host-death family protein
MRTVKIHKAKTQLSKLVDKAAKGEPFIIAKAGKSLVGVTALETAARAQRLGFVNGTIEVPDDFDPMGAQPIQELFEGKP